MYILYVNDLGSPKLHRPVNNEADLDYKPLKKGIDLGSGLYWEHTNY